MNLNFIQEFSSFFLNAFEITDETGAATEATDGPQSVQDPAIFELHTNVEDTDVILLAEPELSTSHAVVAQVNFYFLDWYQKFTNYTYPLLGSSRVILLTRFWGVSKLFRLKPFLENL